MIAQIDDRQLRELLIKRYAGMDRSAPRHLLKFYLKRIGWTAVVRGTSFVKRTLDILCPRCCCSCCCRFSWWSPWRSGWKIPARS